MCCCIAIEPNAANYEHDGRNPSLLHLLLPGAQKLYTANAVRGLLAPWVTCKIVDMHA